MSFKKLGRVTLFALSIFLVSVGVSVAHSLPASILTFSQSDKQLNLSIRLPVEDLTIAAPKLEILNASSLNQDLPVSSIALLNEYFLEHMHVQKGDTELAFTIVSASIVSAENEHVGSYKLLEIIFAGSSLSSKHIFPAMLTYDAVMHEVRNHKTAVFWEQSGASPILLSKFGHRLKNGKPVPVRLVKH